MTMADTVIHWMGRAKAAEARVKELEHAKEMYRQERDSYSERVTQMTAELKQAGEEADEDTAKLVRFAEELHRVKSLCIEKGRENARLREALELSIKQDGCACDTKSVDGHHLYVCYKHEALEAAEARQVELKGGCPKHVIYESGCSDCSTKLSAQSIQAGESSGRGGLDDLKAKPGNSGEVSSTSPGPASPTQTADIITKCRQCDSWRLSAENAKKIGDALAALSTPKITEGHTGPCREGCTCFIAKSQQANSSETPNSSQYAQDNQAEEKKC